MYVAYLVFILQTFNIGESRGKAKASLKKLDNDVGNFRGKQGF